MQVTDHHKAIATFPNYLWFLILSYTMFISMSNWYDARLVLMLGMPISPGALIFPLSFMVSDIITEVYGYKNARLAIWSALFFNLLFVVFGQIIVHMPSPSFATENAAFDRVLQLDLRVIIASFVAYMVSEPINAAMIARIKLYFSGRYMGIRFVLSTVVASLLDSLFFSFIAFVGTYQAAHILVIATNIWLVKVGVELLGIPISVRVAKHIKRLERVDIFDSGVSFNIFRLNSSYERRHNRYPHPADEGKA